MSHSSCSWPKLSQLVQYFRGGGITRGFSESCLGVSPTAPAGNRDAGGLSDCTGQFSVSWSSKISQISQKILGAGFRLTFWSTPALKGHKLLLVEEQIQRNGSLTKAFPSGWTPILGHGQSGSRSSSAYRRWSNSGNRFGQTSHRRSPSAPR